MLIYGFQNTGRRTKSKNPAILKTNLILNQDRPEELICETKEEEEEEEKINI
jgi:hypothetical protein